MSHPELANDFSKDGSIISRIHIWNSGIQIAEHQLIMGVGPGDTGDELMKMYQQYNYKDPYLNKANAHNQFLETLLDLGIAGCVILIGLFFISIKDAYRDRNVLLFIFLLFQLFNLQFESLFSTRAGVIFFSFFFCLMSIIDIRDQNAPISGC